MLNQLVVLLIMAGNRISYIRSISEDTRAPNQSRQGQIKMLLSFPVRLMVLLIILAISNSSAPNPNFIYWLSAIQMVESTHKMATFKPFKTAKDDNVVEREN